MKRSVVLCLLFLFVLLASVLVYAQDAGTSAGSDNAAKDTLTQTAADAGSNLKQGVGNLTGGLAGKGEDLLEREVNLPEPVKIILGSKESQVKISWLIVLVCVFLLLFILVFNLSNLIPFLNKGILRFFVSLIISVLISLSGGTRIFTSVFLDFSDLLNFSRWGVVTLIISVILIFFLILVIFWVANKIKRSSKILDAELKGAQAGAAIDLLNRNYKIEK